MKESYGEDLASHTDPESCTVTREGGREALTGVCAGEPLSREITRSGCRRCSNKRKATPHASISGKRYRDPARSKTLCMHRNSSRENREIPWLPARDSTAGRVGKSKDASQ
jgi:RNA-directed DNA polymerase